MEIKVSPERPSCTSAKLKGSPTDRVFASVEDGHYTKLNSYSRSQESSWPDGQDGNDAYVQFRTDLAVALIVPGPVVVRICLVHNALWLLLQ